MYIYLGGLTRNDLTDDLHDNRVDLKDELLTRVKNSFKNSKKMTKEKYMYISFSNIENKLPRNPRLQICVSKLFQSTQDFIQFFF